MYLFQLFLLSQKRTENTFENPNISRSIAKGMKATWVIPFSNIILVGFGLHWLAWWYVIINVNDFKDNLLSLAIKPSV